MTDQTKQPDADALKGAVENDRPTKKEDTSMAGQIVHRGPDKPADGQDTDFPEPGSNPEHSGQTK